MSDRPEPTRRSQHADVLAVLRRKMLGFEPPKLATDSLFAQVSGFQGAFRGLDVGAVSRLSSLGVAEEINRTLTPRVASDFTKALGAYSAFQGARGAMSLGGTSDFARISERIGRMMQTQQLGKSFSASFAPLAPSRRVSQSCYKVSDSCSVAGPSPPPSNSGPESRRTSLQGCLSPL